MEGEPFAVARSTPLARFEPLVHFDNWTFVDLNVRDTKKIDDGGVTLSASRDNDVDSGHWYQANHKKLNVDFINVPATKSDPGRVLPNPHSPPVPVSGVL